MGIKLSVIVPTRNAATTVGACLEALFASDCTDFEVVLVDDASTDGSFEEAGRFPCRRIRLDSHRGAGAARNRGAQAARGDLLFFTDADCLVLPDTLARALRESERRGPATAIGGSYTPEPVDTGFFGRFQSIFIHHAETKHPGGPDYLATHALAVRREIFWEMKGFAEDFLPILEDVEFSHRLRRAGIRLTMVPDLLVRHIFGYTLGGSLRNAVRKARYWTYYSLGNRDITTDSGTASRELKLNVLLSSAGVFTLCLALGQGGAPHYLAIACLLQGINWIAQRRLLRRFYRTGGAWFCLCSALYYTTLFAAAVGIGGGLGTVRFLWNRLASSPPSFSTRFETHGKSNSPAALRPRQEP